MNSFHNYVRKLSEQPLRTILEQQQDILSDFIEISSFVVVAGF